MPEYFEISLIVDKKKHQKEYTKKHLINRYNLHEGKNHIESNKYPLLENRNVQVGIYEHADTDFEEFCIGLPDYIFSRNTFKMQLQQLTDIVETCFKDCESILFAVCSYEINGYLIGDKKKIKDFDAEFLKRFPIVYSRDSHSQNPVITITLEAQDIFSLNPFLPGLR